MDSSLYEMIFKRKSFHLFRNIGNEKISAEELNEIEEYFNIIKPLNKDIKVKMKIVNDSTTCRRGQEYCLLFYSEKKDNYLQNIGYIGEQLDLYLSSIDIGSLWFGIGKTTELNYNDLDYVMMIAISKVPSDSFRKDMYKSKRKPIEEIYDGFKYKDIINIARFSPSSCNTQPWFIKEENNILMIYRYRKPGKRGIMPKDKVIYQNLVDIGIFLLFVELILKENKYDFKTEICNDNESNEAELSLDFKIIIY